MAYTVDENMSLKNILDGAAIELADDKIRVLEAQAKFESAKMEAAAEIERAKGVAQANKIIGNSLHGNEAYLRYLWIQTLENKEKSVIYVPTEANLPVLEAARLNR